jgi:hypothetical protein
LGAQRQNPPGGQRRDVRDVLSVQPFKKLLHLFPGDAAQLSAGD